MTDDRLRRADTYTHWPDLQAYVREQVEAEVKAKDAEEGRTVVTDDDGDID